MLLISCALTQAASTNLPIQGRESKEYYRLSVYEIYVTI